MNGAESLVRSLLAGGVDVCFANPGTSEMHFVAALDSVPGMRCVLGLFEGVVTGAADGYYRMAERPASTLLHLGPGLANGLANLHNARKAQSGIVNIVGEHATYHIAHDAPLTSDIEGLARPMSDWVRTSPDAKSVAADGAAAIEAARQPPGRIATLILPADTAWGEAEAVATAKPPAPRAKPDAEAVLAAARALTAGVPAMLMLAGQALRPKGLELAGRIAAKTGCRLISEGANARLARGAGRVVVERVPYVVDRALAALAGTRRMVIAGGRPPVAFFAYPGKPSRLAPEDCEFVTLATVEQDLEAALEALAAELGALGTAPAGVAASRRPTLPKGAATADSIAQVLGALMPEDAIVVDESVSTGRGFFAETAGAPPHDWLNNRGGSIGYGLPVAVGAAIASPGRKIVALVGDGSAMYTPQALWTLAREGLDVTVLIFANRTYNILRGELTNVGVLNPGPRAVDMLSIDRPELGWVGLARAMGVDGLKASDCEGLARAFAAGLDRPGPFLVELTM